MNKVELAKEVASRMSVTVTEALRFVDTMCKVVGEVVHDNESVMIQNFGVFLPWQQKERYGRNPRTGVLCPINKRLSVKFRAGKGLLEKLNETGKDKAV